MKLSERKDYNTFFQRYIHFADKIITDYKGGEPFHIHLKKYFALNKRHGSRDRKLIKTLSYDFFRLGNGADSKLSIEEKFTLGVFLCENELAVAFEFSNEYAVDISGPLNKKLESVSAYFDPEKIFPLSKYISSAIESRKYNLSFLIQPALFLRVHSGVLDDVQHKLNLANISWEKMNGNFLALRNETKLENVLNIDQEVFIQDYNSGQTAEYFKKYLGNFPGIIKVWDCCAGSGGKSIGLLEKVKNVQLTVSDKRKSILQNLGKRLHLAGIKNFQSFVLDLSSTSLETGEVFNAIIADVPCTGSGTWARTPEMLHYCSEKEIVRYAALQKIIVRNAVAHLLPGGFLFYITCSVFTEENESNVLFIENIQGLRLMEMKYLKGYEMQADTLFIAIFQREHV